MGRVGTRQGDGVAACLRVILGVPPVHASVRFARGGGDPSASAGRVFVVLFVFRRPCAIES